MILVIVIAAVSPRAAIGKDDPVRPNVVLIMTDNHGAWTLGCYGSPDIRTPNIDRLAADGTLFTRAFSSNPVCSPTRATFLTGLIPSQHGVHSFLGGGNLQIGPNARCTLDELTSLPEVLRDSGYACGLVGKWHLGDNLRPQEGFDDYWITMPHGGTSTFYDANVIEHGAIRKEPKYLTDLWTEHAVKFIDAQAKSDDPFFLFLSYNGPYALSRLLLRDGRNRHAEYYADKQLASFPRETPHPWQLNNLDYINNPTSIRRVATEVSGIDDGVGEVMSALRERGLDDNTIVIFVADQGWVGGHGGFFGMGDHTRPLTARDGMMRIPTIWRHPGRIAAGVKSDRLVTNYDFMPTLLGYLDLRDKLPQAPRSPGQDYSRVLTADADAATDKAPDSVFYEFENLRCIRTATHKYVHRHPNGPHELYDLMSDPDEFVNLVSDPQHDATRENLHRRLIAFYDEFAEPKYDMWNGGTSQVRVHDGIDEEIAQLTTVQPPPAPSDFKPANLQLLDGFTAELVAGPPLVTHPTMGCFDDRGRLYVCNNSGENMSNKELEENLPNSIRMLTDSDHDGIFDTATTFADKMTFPMGGTWHDGALYVASPPNIWRLRDTDDDGVADEREIIVTQFGYTGNAASIHGCFSAPDGRIYWTDGYHGHELKDDAGNVTSKRVGSYIFSCRPDGSDVRAHCGGGMDNPVEIDFNDGGDMLGTVNILYTRPRVDALVHWLYGGAYPHREQVLAELKTSGEFLGPVHRFGHVAVSGMTRYRSGTMDHRWTNNLFTTFFNSGKVVRLETTSKGSSFEVTQHEFLSSTSREFHPTDVLEDADGSLLVIDTGGWFYRGCPTSQFAKPDALGGIYRIRRSGMTPQVDPRGSRIDWATLSAGSLSRLFNDTRFSVRQRAVAECARRGRSMLPTIRQLVTRADLRVRRNCVWALTRMVQNSELSGDASAALLTALGDRVPTIRQAACRGLSQSVTPIDSSHLLPSLADENASVRRAAATALGQIGDAQVVPSLLSMLNQDTDRSEQHAIIFALIEIADVDAIQNALAAASKPDPSQSCAGMIAIDQIDSGRLSSNDVFVGLRSEDSNFRQASLKIIARHQDWAQDVYELIRDESLATTDEHKANAVATLLTKFIQDPQVAALVGKRLGNSKSAEVRSAMLSAIANGNAVPLHPSWVEPLRRELSESEEAKVTAAIAAVAKIQGSTFSQRLKELSQDETLTMTVRLQALAAIAGRSGKLDDETFSLLAEWCQGADAPAVAGRAAQIIGQSRLSDDQLAEIAAVLEHSSPAQLRSLLQCFTRTRSVPVINSFLSSVASADALLTLAEFELSDVIKHYPAETLGKANGLLDRLKFHQQQKRLKLDALRENVRLDGDANRGRQVFLSEKAKCATCHRIGEQGKRVGPDLTTIGANRSISDLLESIVFPSASIVRDYESYKVLTLDGRVLTGLLVSENADAYLIQQASGETVTIARDEIDEIAVSVVSIMPAGLDEALSESELADIVAYLRSLSGEQR